MAAITTPPAFPPIGSATFNADAYAWAMYMAGTLTPELNALLAAVQAIAAGGAVSLKYTFSTTTTDADPGTGILRLDNATQNAATVIRVDLTDNAGSDMTNVLALLDDSTSSNKGMLTLRHTTDATKWLTFKVASMASPSGYRNVTVTNPVGSSATPFTNGDSILLDFTATGDKGDTGETGIGITPQAVGFTLSGGTTSKTLTVLETGTAAITGANTFTDHQTLGENAAIELDAALSADGKYTGIVQAGTAAAALAFGELCYKVTATGKWNKASGAAANVNTVVAAGELGMCVLAAAGDASATMMLRYGNIRADALFDTFTVSAPLYMSAATAGKVVSAQPTGTTDFTVRKIGHAEDANTVFFNPSPDYVTLV